MAKPVLCTPQTCPACQACVNICPVDAIEMKQDHEGFLQPVVDEDICTECTLCEKRCPVISPINRDNNPEPETYACWHIDDNIRLSSSSGGLFSALAEYVIEQENGIVFGAAYDDQLKLVHCEIDSVEELDLLRRSKYIQSDTGSTFSSAKSHLQDGRKVLYVGTPCQIEGLHSFLKKEYENLITADFVCHGVPSPEIFNEYVKHIEDKYQDRVLDVNFRNKKHGWDNGIFTRVTFETKGIKDLYGADSSYFTGMLSDIFLRESCYSCPAIRLPRQSDVTIADFWGIGAAEPFEHQKEKLKGISLLTCNSEKSLSLLPELKKRMVLIPRSFDEAGKGNGHFYGPAKRPEIRDKFFNDFRRVAYSDLITKYLTPSLKRQIEIKMKIILGPRVMNFLRNIKKR